MRTIQYVHTGEPFSLKLTNPDRVMHSHSMDYKKNLKFHLKLSHFYQISTQLKILSL